MPTAREHAGRVQHNSWSLGLCRFLLLWQKAQAGKVGTITRFAKLFRQIGFLSFVNIGPRVGLPSAIRCESSICAKRDHRHRCFAFLRFWLVNCAVEVSPRRPVNAATTAMVAAGSGNLKIISVASSKEYAGVSSPSRVDNLAELLGLREHRRSPTSVACYSHLFASSHLTRRACSSKPVGTTGSAFRILRLLWALRPQVSTITFRRKQTSDNNLSNVTQRSSWRRLATRKPRHPYNVCVTMSACFGPHSPRGAHVPLWNDRCRG